MSLPAKIHQGILNLPGATPESKVTVELLLEKDRENHHCLWGEGGFHNHLSHHILAAYDLGASAKLLQAIYDQEKGFLNLIDERKSDEVKARNVDINAENWTEYLGVDGYYPNYITFFGKEILRLGAGETLEQYVFSPKANGNGAYMLARFLGGAVHPIIQTGYALEFGSNAMLAQALAQAAIHLPYFPEIYDLSAQPKVTPNTQDGTSLRRQPSKGQSLLAILKAAYDSPIMKPLPPYNGIEFLSQHFADPANDPRVAEIKRLSTLWVVDLSRGQAEFRDKLEELILVATLLLTSAGKVYGKPRLDFFAMHVLNLSIFIPSLLKAVSSDESKVLLLRALVPTLLIILLLRGKPRIDGEQIMAHTATPRPPVELRQSAPAPHSTAIGDSRDDLFINPWPQIISSVLHAPDAHTVKAIRILYYAAQQYGTTPAGGFVGVYDGDENEIFKGLAKVDGSVFVRAAGVVMDTLRWVDFGQAAGDWDRGVSAWEDSGEECA